MSISHEFLRNLLESDEGQAAFRAVFEDVHTKRLERVTSIDCPRCGKMRKVDVEVERYPLKDFIAFWSFAANYGIGKPPEDSKRVRISPSKQIEQLSNEELAAIIEGQATVDYATGTLVDRAE
jgi:hypothetical protein